MRTWSGRFEMCGREDTENNVLKETEIKETTRKKESTKVIK